MKAHQHAHLKSYVDFFSFCLQFSHCGYYFKELDMASPCLYRCLCSLSFYQFILLTYMMLYSILNMHASIPGLLTGSRESLDEP